MKYVFGAKNIPQGIVEIVLCSMLFCIFLKAADAYADKLFASAILKKNSCCNFKRLCAEAVSPKNHLLTIVLYTLQQLLCLCDAEFTLSFRDFSRFVCA